VPALLVTTRPWVGARAPAPSLNGH
jgi:hypothetical protein